MATVLQNFELGGAGAFDEVFGTHYAADVYAKQTADATGGNEQQIDETAKAAEAAGAVDQAAAMTAHEVGDVVGSYTKWLVVGAVAVAVIVGFIYLGPLLKRAA